MAGIETCFIPEAIILSEGGVTLVWGSLFHPPVVFQVSLYWSHEELA